MAGGVDGTNNTSYYLYRSNSYWTITPRSTSATSFTEAVTLYRIANQITYGRIDYSYVIVPVINIKNEAIQDMTGSGTSSDPFVVH